jgi:hypothetical protein
VTRQSTSWREQEQRIFSVIGGEDVDSKTAFRRWHKHLTTSLTLPCDVTGIEDFQWEEFFVCGPGDRSEYKELRMTRPSHRDVFELTAVEVDAASEWCLVPDELKAHVRRKTDGKRFVLGLSELKSTDRRSKNYQVLHDYSVWLVNYL